LHDAGQLVLQTQFVRALDQLVEQLVEQPVRVLVVGGNSSGDGGDDGTGAGMDDFEEVVEAGGVDVSGGLRLGKEGLSRGRGREGGLEV
jgi:hypothetical protein